MDETAFTTLNKMNTHTDLFELLEQGKKCKAGYYFIYKHFPHYVQSNSDTFQSISENIVKVDKPDHIEAATQKCVRTNQA